VPPLTTAAIADRLGLPVRQAAELLAELEADGHIEPSPHGWKLTPTAELAYGPALRRLRGALDVRGSPIQRTPDRPMLDAA
jgi:DNA-binding IclR family transcriptional regulator